MSLCGTVKYTHVNKAQVPLTPYYVNSELLLTFTVSEFSYAIEQHSLHEAERTELWLSLDHGRKVHKATSVLSVSTQCL